MTPSTGCRLDQKRCSYSRRRAALSGPPHLPRPAWSRPSAPPESSRSDGSTIPATPSQQVAAPAPGSDSAALLAELPGLLDRQQQVDEARRLVVSFLAAGGDPRRLVAALGSALVRENRNFHTIQCIEAAVRQHELLAGTGDQSLPLVAAAGYLAAHATTTRSQRLTLDIARRLHRGERLYEDEATEPSTNSGKEVSFTPGSHSRKSSASSFA